MQHIINIMYCEKSIQSSASSMTTQQTPEPQDTEVSKSIVFKTVKSLHVPNVLETVLIYFCVDNFTEWKETDSYKTGNKYIFQ